MAKDESDLVFIKGQMLLNVLSMKKLRKKNLFKLQDVLMWKLHILVQKF